MPPLALGAAIHLRHGRALATHPELATAEEQARACERAGIQRVQVIDLDAALGERNQWPQLGRLLSGRRARIDFGGGVRSMTQVQQLLDLGVEHVILGTQAVRNPLWLREVCRIFPGRIILGLDARGERLLVDGGRQEAGVSLLETAASLDDTGLAGMLYRDVDGRLDRELVGRLRMAAPRTPLHVVHPQAGMDDLDWMAEAGVAVAVVGAAGELDLAAAVQRHPGPPRTWPVRILAAREERVLPAGGEEE